MPNAEIFPLRVELVPSAAFNEWRVGGHPAGRRL